MSEELELICKELKNITNLLETLVLKNGSHNNNANEEQKTLSIKEAVALFDGKISEWKLRDYVNKKEIPFFRLGNKDILFDKKSLLLWWQNRVSHSIQPVRDQISEYGKLRKVKE